MKSDTRQVQLIVRWPTHIQCMSHLPLGQEIVALGMFDLKHEGVVYCAYVFTMSLIMWFGWTEIDVSFKLTVFVTWPRCNVAWLQVSDCFPVCPGLFGRTSLLCSQDWYVIFITAKPFLTSFMLHFFYTSF